MPNKSIDAKIITIDYLNASLVPCFDAKQQQQ